MLLTVHNIVYKWLVSVCSEVNHIISWHIPRQRDCLMPLVNIVSCMTDLVLIVSFAFVQFILFP